MTLNPACDGCNEDMTVSHALRCPFGGMTQGRHNLLRDELGLLSQSALTKSQVRSNSPCSAVKTSKFFKCW